MRSIVVKVRIYVEDEDYEKLITNKDRTPPGKSDEQYGQEQLELIADYMEIDTDFIEDWDRF